MSYQAFILDVYSKNSPVHTKSVFSTCSRTSSKESNRTTPHFFLRSTLITKIARKIEELSRDILKSSTTDGVRYYHVAAGFLTTKWRQTPSGQMLWQSDVRCSIPTVRLAVCNDHRDIWHPTRPGLNSQASSTRGALTSDRLSVVANVAAKAQTRASSSPEQRKALVTGAGNNDFGAEPFNGKADESRVIKARIDRHQRSIRFSPEGGAFPTQT